MNGKRGEKPKSMAPISIFFILTALLLFLHVLTNFNFKPIFKISEIMRSMELSVPAFLIILFSLNKYSVIIFGWETAFILLTFLSAIGLLSLKNWARVALIAVAAIEIVFFLGHLGFWATMVTLLPDVTATLFKARSPEALTTLFSYYAGVLFLILILPLVVSIVLLRTEKIRSAMS